MQCCEVKLAATSAKLGTLWWGPQCEMRSDVTCAALVAICLQIHFKWTLAQHIQGMGPLDKSYNASWDWSPLVLSLGMLSKRYRACKEQLLLVWGLWAIERFFLNTQHKPRQATCIGKPLEEVQAGTQVGWNRISGKHKWRVKFASQANKKHKIGVHLNGRSTEQSNFCHLSALSSPERAVLTLLLQPSPWS